MIKTLIVLLSSLSIKPLAASQTITPGALANELRWISTITHKHEISEAEYYRAALGGRNLADVFLRCSDGKKTADFLFKARNWWANTVRILPPVLLTFFDCALEDSTRLELSRIEKTPIDKADSIDGFQFDDIDDMDLLDYDLSYMERGHEQILEDFKILISDNPQLLPPDTQLSIFVSRLLRQFNPNEEPSLLIQAFLCRLHTDICEE